MVSAADRFAADALKRAQLKETIRVSRQAQLDRKAAEAERQRLHDDTMTREWRKRNLEMQEQEWLEEQRTLENNLRLQSTLREQMITKEERVRSEVSKEWEEARMMRDARDREDAVFAAYSEQVFGDLQVRGKSTIPLQLTLHRERMKAVRPGNFVSGNFRFR